MKRSGQNRRQQITADFLTCFALIFVALVLGTQTGLTREKSDVITLKNGNTISGEIQQLRRGLLSVKTDAMGTLDIKWEDVRHIRSKFVFVVEDTRGRLYVGTLQPAEDPQRVNVVGPNPAGNLSHLSIVEMDEVGSSLWTRLSGSIELGYTFSKASSRQQLNAAMDLAYRTKRYEGEFTYDSIISHSNGEMDVDRRVLTLGASVYLSNKWQLLSKAAWEHNLELQLDRRLSLLGAPAYDILKTNRSSFLLVGGLAWTRENYFEQQARSNIEGAFGIDFQFFKLYSPKLDLSTSFYVMPNFSTSGRLRTEFDTKLRFEIFKDFYVNFSVYNSYDNRPPSETASTNDYGFVTGISWTFHR